MKSDTLLLLLFLLMATIIASVDCWRRCPKGHFSPRHTECRPCRICRDTKVIRPCTHSQDTVCADVLRTKVIHFPCIFEEREMLGLFVESRVSTFPDMKKKTRQKIKRDACSSLKKYKKRILDSRKIPYDGCAAGTYLGTSVRSFSNYTSVRRTCLHCSDCPHGTHVVYPCQGRQDTVCSFPRVNNTVELFHFTCAKRGPTLQVYSSRPPSVSHTRLRIIRRKLQNNLCWISHEAYRNNKHGFKKRRRNDAPLSFPKHQDAGKTRIHAGPPPAVAEGQGEQTDEERRPVLSEAKQPKQRRLKNRAGKDEGKQLLNNEASFSSEASRKQELRPRGKKQKCSGKQETRARARCRKRNRGDKRLHQSQPPPATLPGPSSQSVRGGPEFGSIADPTPTGTTTTTLAVATKRIFDETADKLTTLMEQKAKTSPALVDQEQPELELEEDDSDQEEDVKEKDNVLHIVISSVVATAVFVVTFATLLIYVKRNRRSQNSSGPKRDQGSGWAYNGYSKQNQFNEILAQAEPEVPDSCSSITSSPPLSHSGNYATNVVASHYRNSPRSEDSGFVSCNASSRGSGPRLCVDSARTERCNALSRGSGPQPCRESKNIYRLVESPAKQEEFHRLSAVSSLSPTSWSARSLPSSVGDFVPEGSDDDDDGVGLHVLGCRVDSSDDPSNLPYVPRFTDVCRNQDSNTEATTDMHVGPNTISQLRCADVLSDSCSSQQLFDCDIIRFTEAEISLPPKPLSCTREDVEDGLDSFSDFKSPPNGDYAAMHLERQGSGGFSDCCRLSFSSDQSDASGLEPANPHLYASSSRRTGQVQITLAAITGLQERSARDSVAFLSDTSSLSHYESSPPSSDSEKELSRVSQATTGSTKPRPLSENSTTSSAASSVCMHIKIALNDLAKGDDWLQKDSTARPENLLSTYSSSVTTQTDDWDKTNLRPKPIFCSSWQVFQSFSPAGGTLTLPNSDVRLEVPPNAVPSGSYADVTAATYTNLSHLRRVLKLGEEEMMVGPLAEFHAGSGFRFQEKVHLYLPHCLPLGVAEEHVKLHHIDRGQGGELVVKLLPSKKEYDLRHEGRHRTKRYPTEEQLNPELERGAGEEEEKEDEEEEEGGGGKGGGGGEEEEDIGFFQFLPSGELLVSTTYFCGYICTICNERCPEPRIQLVATAKQILRTRRSGDLLQVSIFLYLWDRKILIADFQRDYFGSRVVGRQTLHVIEDYEESLVKVEFGLYDTESDGEDDGNNTQHQSWRHALRPRTTDPVFPAKKEFPLKELLCCQAKDSPRCEEWLAENLVKPNESGHDFQCFIDIYNTSNNLSEGGTNGQLSKQVTMFIGDINNNNNINNSGLGNPKDVPEQPKTGIRDGESYPPNVPYHQAPAEQQPTTVSNTPFGQREQGPSSTFSRSYFPGWQPLSDTPHLDPIPVREWRISDPIITSAHFAESPEESSRPVSCPPGDLVSSSLPGPAADGVVRAGQGTQTTAVDEEELEQQDRRGGGSIRRHVPNNNSYNNNIHQQTVGLPTPFVNGERHDDDDDDGGGDDDDSGGGTEAQQDDELKIPTEATPIPTAAEGLAELQLYGEEARRKRFNAAADRYLQEQSGRRVASRGESFGRVCDPGPNNRRGSALNQLQETQVICSSSISVHGADAVLRLDGRRDS